MIIDQNIQVNQLRSLLDQFWELSGKKILDIEKSIHPDAGAPVFTINGNYTSRGWTEWTQGFQYGSSLIQYEITREEKFLTLGKKNTLEKMTPHLTHTGVHDHGFNNISTYGNLLRMMIENTISYNEWEKHYYQLAIKISGTVQGNRWTSLPNGGFIYSFNGPHSLFVDTIRSCRILFLSYMMGHKFLSENDKPINLMERGIQHLITTANYSIYYGEGRDQYDVSGRTAHESIFNTNDGQFRCPNAQQGFSGFTTWTRGLAWAMCGFAEELEFFSHISDHHFSAIITKKEILKILLRGARATCDFYIQNSSIDGIPYWDTGAPQLHKLGNYTEKKADPYNPFEPVDSSAAAIGAQGLIRLGIYLKAQGDPDGSKYYQAGLTIANTLLQSPYLSLSNDHQGLILHSIYHHPNGWDHIPDGYKIPCEESSMWGDYHARELGLMLHRIINDQPYYHYYDCLEPDEKN